MMTSSNFGLLTTYDIKISTAKGLTSNLTPDDTVDTSSILKFGRYLSPAKNIFKTLGYQYIDIDSKFRIVKQIFKTNSLKMRKKY